VVQAHAVLEVPDRVLDLGVAAVVGLELERLAVAIGDDRVIVVTSTRSSNAVIDSAAGRVPSGGAVERLATLPNAVGMKWSTPDTGFMEFEQVLSRSPNVSPS